MYGYYRLWVRLGVWEQINDLLVRQAAGRNAQPSLAIVDSQSVKLGQKAIILNVKHESDIAQR